MRKYIGRWGLGVLRIGDFRGVTEVWGDSLSKRVVSKLYGVNATIIIFVFVLYCIVRVVFIIVLKGYFVLNLNFTLSKHDRGYIITSATWMIELLNSNWYLI